MSIGTRQRGFALVGVLWTIMIVALIAGSMIGMMRSDAHLAHARASLAQDQALLDGALAAAILQLTDPDPKRWPARDATPWTFTFEGQAIHMQVQDESGRIDLNTAPADVLMRLFVSAGLSMIDAQTEADRTLDWREPGDLKRLNGAKRSDYEAAGLSYGPRGGPFQSVDELRLVMGMAPAIFTRIAPALTVYGQQASIDPAVAPREALFALPDATEDSVAQTIAARQNGGAADPAVFTAFPTLVGHAFTIDAQIATARRQVTRTAVIRLSGDMQTPIWVYQWK